MDRPGLKFTLFVEGSLALCYGKIRVIATLAVAPYGL